PGVAVRAPLHGCAHRVAATEPDVVAHADLVAVVQDGRAGQGQQQGGEELDLVAIVVQQRCEPAPDPHVGTHTWFFGVLGVHVVALFVGDHFQGQFVVV